MKSEFSETQFAISLTYEIIKKNNIKRGYAPPRFPSQVKEAAFGYDFALDGPCRTIYLQFKISEKKTNQYARHWSDHNCPYYVFELYSRNGFNQHNKLVKLAKKNKRNRVYYCAPGFVSEKEYCDYFQKERIMSNTIFVPVDNLGTISPSDKHHDVSFTIHPYNHSRIHSEPKTIKSLTGDEFFSETMEIPSYDSFTHCISSLSDQFEINISRCEDRIEKYHEISSRLLTDWGISLLVLPS